MQDEKQKLQVFERGGVYLATRKIGKNNPKAHETEVDNQKRQEWNRAVDMALISGIPELQILEVKRKQSLNQSSNPLLGMETDRDYLPEL